MIRTRKPLVIQYTARACLALTAACSSGGGGGRGMSPAVVGSLGTVALVTSSLTPPPSESTDTGIAAPVSTPAPASFGTAPIQIATPGGPSYDGSSGSYSKNATFPLTLSSLQKTATGLSPVPADLAATATLVSTSASDSAKNLGAAWPLSDGTKSAIGALAAKQ